MQSDRTANITLRTCLLALLFTSAAFSTAWHGARQQHHLKAQQTLRKWQTRRYTRRLTMCLVMSMVFAQIQATPSSGMFSDWLSQQQTALQPEGKRASASAAYSEVETVEACLREVSDRNCMCLHSTAADACVHLYVESRFACCSDSSDSAGALLREGLPVAQCIFTEDYLDREITYDGTKAVKIGTFTARCELSGGVSKCGQELCQGTQLVAQGSVMRYNNIAFVGKPSAPTQDEACKKAPEGPLSNKNDFSNTAKPGSDTPNNIKKQTTAAGSSKGMGAAAATPAATPAQYATGDQLGIYTGSGDIYSGSMQIHSSASANKYDSGHFQLVYVRELDSDAPVDAMPQDYFVTKPYVLSLELYKAEAYPTLE